MPRDNMKRCPKCGNMTWASSAECAYCESPMPWSKNHR